MRSYAEAQFNRRGSVIGFLNLGSSKAVFSPTGLVQLFEVFPFDLRWDFKRAPFMNRAELATLKKRQLFETRLHDAVSPTLFSAKLVIAESCRRIAQELPTPFAVGLRGNVLSLNRRVAGTEMVRLADLNCVRKRFPNIPRLNCCANFCRVPLSSRANHQKWICRLPKRSEYRNEVKIRASTARAGSAH